MPKESGQRGQKGRKEIPMLSLQRPHGSNPRRHLMVPISTHNITQASRLTPGTPLVQHLCSLRHPPRGKLPKFQLRTRLDWPVIPTRQGTSLRGHFKNSPTPNNVRRPLAVPHRQPFGRGNSRKGPPNPLSQSGMTLTHLASTMGLSRGIPLKNAWPLNTRSNI